MHTKRLLIVLFLLAPIAMLSQTLSGYVMDQDNNPIPFVNVYFQGTQEATNTKDDGSYFHQLRNAGFYEVVYSAVGYKNTKIEVTFDVGEKIVKNIYLERDVKEIKEAVIKAKRRDPAYEIIANAIDAKDKWKKQYESSKSHVYIKASEVITEKEKKKREKEAEQEKKARKSGDKGEEEDKEDIFEKEKREKEEAINKVTNGMNMVEIDMERSFQYPNKVKEIRNGYKKLGSSYGLYFINTAEADFNFYDNLMNIENLNELPLISPLHITSILTYKFSLVETTYDGPNQIFKIEVTPRKKGNASWTGFIWIQNENYCIRKVDLTLEKGGLYVYDEFRIQQTYELQNDSLILLTEQEFDYLSKSGGSKFIGNTYVKYSDYELNVDFPKNYFRNEVAVTTQEAYDKDSTYWQNSRPKPLTIKEQRFQFLKDSIETVRTSKVYLDSLDLESNKVTFLDVAWWGIDHINRNEKRMWYLNPLASVWNPFSIGGARLGYGGSYFKRWENQKYFAGNVYSSYGLRNKDVKGNVSFTYLYDPMHQGSITLIGADRFNVVAANDAITNILQRSNWIQERTGQIIYRRELFNGLYVRPSFVLIERRSIADLLFNPDADDLVPDNEPYDFDTYDGSIFDLELSYTPFQKYMTEPFRKVVLGSKWPTFSVGLQTGIPDLFGSDVQFTRVTGRINQSFKLGTMGTTSYKVQGGKFLNTNVLTREDSKIFPRADRWLFASLMESMQLQDTTLIARDIYLQAHVMHHFNGAVVNYIPLVKKLGIHFSAGASALYIKDSNYRYVEGFVGVERSFKIQRYRYRVGLFFVAADDNNGSINPRMKIAFSQYNIRDKSWGY